MEEKYAIWKRIETAYRGDPYDESETSSSKSSIIIVSPKEKEKWDEEMADALGSQDYSWRIQFKKIGEIDMRDFSEVRTAMNKMKNLM